MGTRRNARVNSLRSSKRKRRREVHRTVRRYYTSMSAAAAANPAPPLQKQTSTGGLLRSRYSSHPNCDICGVGFDISKRRHQWYSS